jgi:hypothetical protein
MTATLYKSLGLFSGVNNVDDPVELSGERILTSEGYKFIYPLQIAENVYIDNEYGLHSRAGYALALAGKPHSMWSNLDKSICLFVEGSSLFRFNEDESITQLVAGLTFGLPMSYAEFNDRIYFSNDVNIGYLKENVPYQITVPTAQFKLPLPPGKFLAVYRARLYVAKGPVLYIGDALSDCYDVRGKLASFRNFSSDITMVQPVDNGIYVSDSEQVWFLKGLGPDEMTREVANSSPAIPYTNQLIGGQYVGDGAKHEDFALWTGASGICMGDSGGAVGNVTVSKFVMSKHNLGAAVVKITNNEAYYINTLRN